MIITVICKLYIFCGRRLLAARLQRSNIDGAAECDRGGGTHCRADPSPLAEDYVFCCAAIPALPVVR